MNTVNEYETPDIFTPYHENYLSKITHGPQIHNVILITAVWNDDLRANPTYKDAFIKNMKTVLQ